MNPLALLARSDKWFLGGGKGAIYAPPFPRHLLAPGFWDECYFADIRLHRLFTLTFLNAHGAPQRFHSEHKGWRPDRLFIEHSSTEARLLETRVVLENQTWVSRLEVIEAKGSLDVFMWSLQDYRQEAYGTPWTSLRSPTVSPEAIRFAIATAWPGQIKPDRTAVEQEDITGCGEMLPPLHLYLTLGADRPSISHSVWLAQRQDDAPLWELSVVPEAFNGHVLDGKIKLGNSSADAEGMIHLVQHYRISAGDTVQFACAAGLTEAVSSAAFEETMHEDAVDRSGRDWQSYFRSVPQFSSSDPHLNSAYWNRWYGLRLNTVDISDLPIQGGGFFKPFVTEGIGFFRNFITYSAQAHLREVAWMHEPGLAAGILENLVRCQHPDGCIPGHNYSCRPARDFYHADFATGAETLEKLHSTSAEIWLWGFSHYLQYFAAKRSNHEGPAIGFLIFDQNETGQEYMSRYSFAHPEADQWMSFRVLGVDANCYLLKLANYTWERTKSESAGDCAQTALKALIECYDRDAKIWRDRLPDGTCSAVTPATSLYPLLYLEETAETAVDVASAWLLNSFEFWLPKGFPATPVSDETFSAAGEWKDRRLNCPWSGRSWPMVNSHLVDALANVARKTGNPELRRAAGDALLKCVKLMFHNGDASRPNSFEHYNPITGMPALYRGYDDYMHSWVIDLILRHAVGVQPGADEVDPLLPDVEWIECREIPHPRGWMHVKVVRGESPIVEITEKTG